jgi:hypothetical protein
MKNEERMKLLRPTPLPYKRYCVGIVAGRETLRLDNFYRLNAICAPAFTHPDDVLVAVIHHEPNQEKKLDSESYSKVFGLNLPLSCLGLINGSVSEISKFGWIRIPYHCAVRRENRIRRCYPIS